MSIPKGDEVQTQAQSAGGAPTPTAAPCPSGDVPKEGSRDIQQKGKIISVPHDWCKSTDSLLEIWRKVGLATFCKGAYRTIDPKKFAPLMERVFPGGAPLDHKDMTPYILTSFGSIFISHKIYGVVNLELPIARCIVRRDPALTDAWSRDIQLIMSFPVQHGDVDNIGDFARAKKKLGALAPDEIYCYVPALPLGGSPNTAHVEKARADVHLDILSQLRPVEIFTMVKADFGYQLAAFEPSAR